MKLKRNSPKDWEGIYELAKQGKWEEVPKDVLIRSYSSLKRIHVDNLKPEGFVKEVVVCWGKTGLGKSKYVWETLGLDAYPKDPRTKNWDAYQLQDNVIMEEFRGDIDISHMLRWLDRYPVIVDVKYSSIVLRAKKIYITSNISPDFWYPSLDEDTRLALRRRITKVFHFVELNRYDET